MQEEIVRLKKKAAWIRKRVLEITFLRVRAFGGTFSCVEIWLRYIMEDFYALILPTTSQ